LTAAPSISPCAANPTNSSKPSSLKLASGRTTTTTRRRNLSAFKNSRDETRTSW
jgi:hypothetical protein